MYCNPLYVEDYPRGHGGESDREEERDYRSLADPEVLYLGGRWYMYPTYAMAWVSDDMAHWRRQPVVPEDVGPAPSVMRYRDQFYLSAGDSPLYVSDEPLGPFRALGYFRKPDQSEVKLRDAMLFADDDGRAYLYWGLGSQGIFGVELCPDDLTQMKSEPISLIRFDPSHAWERFGEHNQSFGQTYLEGAYLLKEQGRYYLVYSAPGTCYGTYCLAAYVSESGPLSGFRCQRRNPILAGRQGVVRGPGHGSFTRDRNGELWCYYTIALCHHHKYERRIAMDRAFIDDHGELFVDGPSDTPRPTPGEAEVAVYPLTSQNPTRASSHAAGRESLYAVDESLLTWWQPDDADERPWLSVRLKAWYAVSSVRVVWRDVGLDYAKGVTPGAIRYIVEGHTPQDTWVVLVDRRNAPDVNCDFCAFSPVTANEVRLRIAGCPRGIRPGLLDLTAFGTFASDERQNATKPLAKPDE